jgi:citronellol/citronellal dehydrogenase
VGEAKTAIVAGGGSGIGQACARKLAGVGYEVILLGRTPERLDAAAEEISQAGGRARTFAGDVRDWDRMGELAGQVAADGLDLLINSAGGQFYAPAAEISPKGWHAVVDLNLTGAFYLARQLQPALKRRRGAIVHVVANLWRRAAPGLAHSGAARAGVVSLTRSLALEWAADGIRVNAVSPGVTDTPALRNYPKHAETTAAVPLRRLATPEEVADAILFIGQSGYITGEVLTIDGGLHLVT